MRRQAGAPLFYKERLGTKSPPHPPQCAHWGTFPPRGRLWGWVLSFRVSTVPPIYPAGHASQSFPARRRGKKIQSCFDRLRRPKHTSHPESASFAGAVRGASPNFGSPAQRVPKFPSALVFFPPAFFQRKPGSPPESAGPPGRCAPKVLRSYPPVGYVAPCCPWQGAGFGLVPVLEGSPPEVG